MTDERKMLFDLKTPCSDCPFRRDIHPTISSERVMQIIEGLVLQGIPFQCHNYCIVDTRLETLAEGPELQHCAGAAIFLENVDEPNFGMLKAEEEGRYKPDQYKDRDTIFRTMMEAIKAHAESRVVVPWRAEPKSIPEAS